MSGVPNTGPTTPKKGRGRPRSFDYEAAYRLRITLGFTTEKLATKFGVSKATMERVLKKMANANQ